MNILDYRQAGQLWPVLEVFITSLAEFSIFLRFIVVIPLE